MLDDSVILCGNDPGGGNATYTCPFRMSCTAFPRSTQGHRRSAAYLNQQTAKQILTCECTRGLLLGGAECDQPTWSLWLNLTLAMLLGLFFLALTIFVIKRLPGTVVQPALSRFQTHRVSPVETDTERPESDAALPIDIPVSASSSDVHSCGKLLVISSTVAACVASFCYGLLPLAYAHVQPREAYMVLESITLVSAWVVSATQAVLLASITLDILDMCLLLKLLVGNMQRLLLPGIALCNAVVLSLAFASRFSSLPGLRVGQPVVWELMALLMSTSPILVMGLAPFQSLAERSEQTSIGQDRVEAWCSVIATLRCVALVSSVSVLLLLLHVFLWARRVYLPIQVSIYVIAWARTVISLQLFKMCGLVKSPNTSPPLGQSWSRAGQLLWWGLSAIFDPLSSRSGSRTAAEDTARASVDHTTWDALQYFHEQMDHSDRREGSNSGSGKGSADMEGGKRGGGATKGIVGQLFLPFQSIKASGRPLSLVVEGSEGGRSVGTNSSYSVRSNARNSSPASTPRSEAQGDGKNGDPPEVT